MSTASPPRMKAALYTALQALQATTLVGVQISYGDPAPVVGRELIWLGDVEGEQHAVFLGRQSRNEAYSLSILVWVERQATKDQQAVTERAYAIAGVIENTLRADGTLGGVVREALVSGPFKLEEIPAEDGLGRKAALLMTVSVTNRI